MAYRAKVRFHHCNIFVEKCFLFHADINECVMDTDMCHVNAECNNTIGTYQCTCKVGYSGDGFNCTGMLTTPYIILNCYFVLM